MQARRATKPRSRNERNISRTIVEAVADAEGVNPVELESCLYNVIDPDALNMLFKSTENRPATEGEVSFTFHGYTVRVHSDSTVEIEQE